MNRLILISCSWLLKKTLVITTNSTYSESASGLVEHTSDIDMTYRNDMATIHTDQLPQKSKISSGHMIYRSSHSEVFLGKGVLKICSKFTGEHPCRSAISIKLLCNFIEISFHHGCSAVNLLHIFRTPFLKNTSGGLLLDLKKIVHETLVYPKYV